MQTQLSLISHEVEGGEVVHQRASDGYVNATAMCKSAGKLFSDYRRLKATGEFTAELSRSMGIPIDLIIQSVASGLNEGRGTWVHPDLAINLGQWLSPRFAVQVSQWVREWMSGKNTPIKMPHHIQRYMMNRGKIPSTHFSMLNEITMVLVAPLESKGYTIPDNLLPDGSEGKIFCKWLRDNKSANTDAFPRYPHEYPDGRVFNAKLYPNEYLADFRWHFNEVWLPDHAPKYFSTRDKAALSHVTKILLPPVAA